MSSYTILIIFVLLPAVIFAEGNITIELLVEKLPTESDCCYVGISCGQPGQKEWKTHTFYHFGVDRMEWQIPREMSGKCSITSYCDAQYGTPVEVVRFEDCKMYEVVLKSGKFRMVQEHKNLSKECEFKQLLGNIEKAIVDGFSSLKGGQSADGHTATESPAFAAIVGGFSSLEGDQFADGHVATESPAPAADTPKNRRKRRGKKKGPNPVAPPTTDQ